MSDPDTRYPTRTPAEVVRYLLDTLVPNDAPTDASFVHRRIRGHVAFQDGKEGVEMGVKDDTPIDGQTIERVTQRVKPKEAAGLVLVKNSGHIIGGYLLVLFRACIKLGYYQKDWRTARVVAVGKPGSKPDTLQKQFRPISLEPVLDTLLQRVVMDSCPIQMGEM